MEAIQELFVEPVAKFASEFKKGRITPFEVESIRATLSDIEESIQELNTPFEIEKGSALQKVLAQILGESLGSALREATLARMIDSVNLHDDQEMVIEQEIQSHFIIIVLETNVDDAALEFSDSAQGSELIHVSSDNTMTASSIATGRIIVFDATKPHAYLSASNEDALLLIVDFNLI